MSDADCPRCGGDNLTDYPVCQDCAHICHFPHRAAVGKECWHCKMKLLQMITEGTNGDNRA